VKHLSRIKMVNKREEARLNQLKISVEQLRRESNLERKPVSESIKDLIEFVNKNKANDDLIPGNKKQCCTLANIDSICAVL